MKKFLFAAATFLAVGLSSMAARADDLNLILTRPSQEISAAGGILAFEATISAPLTNLDSVYLNGDAYTLAGGFTMDDSGFMDFPLYLQPGETFTGILFKVTVPAALAGGTYANTFSILGGGLGALDTAATVGFNVSVVPEPSSLSLAMAGALVGLILLKRKGSRFSPKAKA